MTDFMILLRENASAQAQLALKDLDALLARRADFVADLAKQGVFRDAERLRPTAEGKRVRAGSVEDGPFSEPSELAGYVVVQAESLQQAMQIADGVPLAPGDSLDVRPVMGGIFRPDRSQARGKVFAFAVLGNAKSEAEWVTTMDQIDRETGVNARDARFLGGVRLHAPGRGRQMELRGHQRTVMDGPFMEAKEVIGGLFFMHLPDLAEAIAWAQRSRFMPYGALEVRELWRS